jgi:ATPase
VALNFGKNAIGTAFDIMVEDEYLFTATVGKKGSIKVKKDIELADIIIKSVKKDIPVRARIRQE